MSLRGSPTPVSEHLQFDAATHTYTVGGRPVPNVTRILSPLVDYSMIPAGKLEIARQKGVAVHKMVELDARGDLDEDGLPDWMRPVLKQWRKYCADTGFTVIESERKVYHQTYGYAGTLDLIGTFGGQGDEHALIDVKRSFLAGQVIGLQTAAYAEAYIDEIGHKLIVNRYALRLNENGPYRLEPYPGKTDFQSFLTCLSFHKLKARIAK